MAPFSINLSGLNFHGSSQYLKYKASVSCKISYYCNLPNIGAVRDSKANADINGAKAEFLNFPTVVSD